MPTLPTLAENTATAEVAPLIAPILLLLGGVLGGRAKTPVAWSIGRSATALALLAAVAAPLATVREAPWDLALQAIQILITFLGWVLARFASRYLAGEANQPFFVRWLLTALGAAALVPAGSHLLLIALAWLGTGLALRKLLEFHPDRPVAREAAERKFLVTRVADVSFLLAVGLLFARFGTLDRAAIHEAIRTAPELGLAPQFAALLVAAAAILRTAQVPFQGWLIRVVDAPTPVSALLHAGVVNLGGVVLLALHPLLTASPAARTLLVLSGAATALFASWTGASRVSFKTGLAWSTSSQMGFMLLQCGLGLYEMAWLHLIAHSVYKARAFLSAGSVVRAPIERRRPFLRAHARLGAAVTLPMLGILVGVGVLDPAREPAWTAMAVVVALAVAPLVGQCAQPGGMTLVAAAAVVVAVYALLHTGLNRWLGQHPVDPTTMALSAVTATAFLGLFAARYALPPQTIQRLGRLRLEA
ncbi:MAG: proton-conducting transporter membrane subunit [Planctomycetota bacterium]